jgi:hypothetical protein
MIDSYFKNFGKSIVMKGRAGAKPSTGKARSKSGSKITIDTRLLKEALIPLIPLDLTIETVRPVDSGGFSPEGVDLVAYRKYCPDIIGIMGGYVPGELIYGFYHIVQELTRDSLEKVLDTIAKAKKLNMFTDGDEAGAVPIPSFVIAANTRYKFSELKNDITNYYMTKSIEHQYEMDILLVLRKGVVVKNWREKRSFIALETLEDSAMWFYILMIEYLDVERVIDIDFRKYVKKDVIYNEY